MHVYVCDDELKWRKRKRLGNKVVDE